MGINLYKKKTINNQPVLEELLSKSTDTVDNKPLVYDSTTDNVKSADNLNVNSVTASCFHGPLDGTAKNATCFNNKTYAEACADILSGCAADSNKLNGKTYSEVCSDILSGCAADSNKLNGKTYAKVCADILSGTAANATCFAGKTCTEWKDIIKTTCVDNAALATNATCFNGCTYSEACTDIRNGLATQACADAIQNCANYIQSCVTAIENKIPDQASASNQLADKDFVNSSITTNTANFRGTYACVADLPSTGNTNNDYAFVCSLNTTTGNYIYDRYKWVASDSCWVCEYELNTTGFTAEQLASINSGITSNLVAKITDVYDNTVTVCMNGECKGSFNLNQNTDVCIDLGNTIRNAYNANYATNATCFNGKTYSEAKTDILSGNAASATNATCFNGKTYAYAKSDIRSGLISDIGVKVYCGTTCKCTLAKDSSLCLSANAFNENATISTDTYPGACCTGTSNYVVTTMVCCAKTVCRTQATTGTCHLALFGGNANRDNADLYVSSACPITYSPATGVLTACCVSANNTNPVRTVAYSASHSAYSLIASTKVSSGVVGYTSMELTLFSVNSVGSYPVGHIFIDFSSGVNANAWNIQGFTDININDSSNAYYPRIVVSKDTENYNIYVQSTYTYARFRVEYKVSNNSAIPDTITATDSPSGTIVFDSSTDKTKIVYVKNVPSAMSIDVCTSSCNAEYPLVFSTCCATPAAGNRTLYNDSANNLMYNPSTNTLTACTFCNSLGQTLGAKNNICASSLGFTVCADYSLSCVIATLGSCYGAKPGTYTFRYENATSFNIVYDGSKEISYNATIEKFDDIDTSTGTYKKSRWQIKYANGTEYTITDTVAGTAGTHNYTINKTSKVATTVCNVPSSASTICDVTITAGCYSATAPTNYTWCFCGCNGVMYAPNSLCVGSTGGRYTGGSIELCAPSPFVDFHFNNYTGDYSSRLINNAQGNVQLIVNNGTGTTTDTQSANFDFCSNGTLKATCFCGNLCGSAQKVCRNAITSNASCHLALLAGNNDSDNTCIYVSSACPLTYNPATGVLCAKCFCGNVTASGQIDCAKAIKRYQATTGNCHIALFNGNTAVDNACTYVSNGCPLTFNPATGELLFSNDFCTCTSLKKGAFIIKTATNDCSLKATLSATTGAGVCIYSTSTDSSYGLGTSCIWTVYNQTSIRAFYCQDRSYLYLTPSDIGIYHCTCNTCNKVSLLDNCVFINACNKFNDCAACYECTTFNICGNRINAAYCIKCGTIDKEYSLLNIDNDCTAIGKGARALNGLSTAIGYLSCSSLSGVAVGQSACSLGGLSIGNCSCSSYFSIAIGCRACAAGAAHSLALGNNTYSFAACFGSTVSIIRMACSYKLGSIYILSADKQCDIFNMLYCFISKNLGSFDRFTSCCIPVGIIQDMIYRANEDGLITSYDVNDRWLDYVACSSTCCYFTIRGKYNIYKGCTATNVSGCGVNAMTIIL